MKKINVILFSEEDLRSLMQTQMQQLFEKLQSCFKNSNETSGTPELLTITDVEKILRVTRSTIYKLIESSQLKSVKISGRRMFRRMDIQAFVNAKSINL